jgi:hypothetical protein
MKSSEILRGAAAEIEKRGWCQGFTEDAQGRVCTMGAIQQSDEPFSFFMGRAWGEAHRLQDERLRPVLKSLAKTFEEQLGVYPPSLSEGPPPGAAWLDWLGPFIANVNDLPTTTREDILSCMEKAAVGLEEQGQ